MKRQSRKLWTTNYMQALNSEECSVNDDINANSDISGNDDISDRSDISDQDDFSETEEFIDDPINGAVQTIEPKTVLANIVQDRDIPNLSDLGRLALAQSDDPLMEDLIFLETLVNKTYPERLKALHTLRNTIRSSLASPYFDDEDNQWIEDDIKNQQQEMQKLRDIWKQTSSIYQNTLLKLVTTIHARQRVLSHVDGQTNIFTQRPKLVEQFAKKQAVLSNIMEICKEKIRKEQHEIREKIAKEEQDQLAIMNDDIIDMDIVNNEHIPSTKDKSDKLSHKRKSHKKLHGISRKSHV